MGYGLFGSLRLLGEGPIKVASLLNHIVKGPPTHPVAVERNHMICFGFDEPQFANLLEKLASS